MGDPVRGEHSCYFPRGPGGESAHREGHTPAMRAAAARLEEGVAETGLSGHFWQQPSGFAVPALSFHPLSAW